MHVRRSSGRPAIPFMATLAAVAVLLALAPAAHAQGTRVSDPRGDSWASDSGDITQLRLAHRDRKVLVKVRTRNYTSTYHVMFDVNRQSRFDFKATWEDEDWAYGARPTMSITDARGRLRCAAPWRFLDDRQVMFFSVPRWCLDSPGGSALGR